VQARPISLEIGHPKKFYTNRGLGDLLSRSADSLPFWPSNIRASRRITCDFLTIVGVYTKF
jgi:hypothetical protein